MFASLNCISDWFLDLLINNKSVRSELVEDSKVCLIQTRLSGSPIEAWIPDSSIQDMNLPTDQSMILCLSIRSGEAIHLSCLPIQTRFSGSPIEAWIPDSSIQDMNLPTDQAWSSVLAFEAEKPSIHHVHILL